MDAELRKSPPESDTTLQSERRVVEACLETARRLPWQDTTLSEPALLLERCAVELERSRADLIHIMNIEAKKNAAGGDVEASEAVDFSNYYSHSFRNQFGQDGRDFESIGPNCIHQFVCAKSASLPKLSSPMDSTTKAALQKAALLLSKKENKTLQAAAGNAAYWWQEEFNRPPRASPLPAGAIPYPNPASPWPPPTGGLQE